MVRHVILWKLKDMPEAEKTAVKAGIKAGLEGLAGQIPGLLEVHVYTDVAAQHCQCGPDAGHHLSPMPAALKGYCRSTRPTSPWPTAKYDPTPRCAPAWILTCK